jgi:hypothetical protein
MPSQIPQPPDAREVVRIEALVTADDPDRAQVLLEHLVPGSSWTAKIRTAEVTATLVRRTPLGTFAETVCTCVSLRLPLPVPVEPGLRFRIENEEQPGLSASAVVRPWGG